MTIAPKAQRAEESSAIHRVLGSIIHHRTALHLETTDLCFLIALHEKAVRAGLTSFEEDLLLDVFEQVCELADPEAGSVRKRATHALTRLREQRLLGRVDGSGLVQTGQFAMSPLARSIVEFFVKEEGLTRESLDLLTQTLRSELLEIRSHAQQAHTPEDWSRRVVARLRVTVSDLVTGIERRQRGLDVQQEEVRAQIGQLLKHDWFEAVVACETLLETTTETLRELHEVLLRDAGGLLELLADIEQLASAAEALEAEAAALDAASHVERVQAWGGDRQRAWSDYFQYVQRYLRTVVRLDPDRAVSQRLRDALTAWPDRPFWFLASDQEPLFSLRELDTRPVRPPVVRPREDRERTLESAASETGPQLEELVREALDQGCCRLSEILDKVLPRLESEARFRATGRIAEMVARARRLRTGRERPWVRVERLEVEEWNLE